MPSTTASEHNGEAGHTVADDSARRSLRHRHCFSVARANSAPRRGPTHIFGEPDRLAVICKRPCASHCHLARLPTVGSTQVGSVASQWFCAHPWNKAQPSTFKGLGLRLRCACANSKMKSLCWKCDRNKFSSSFSG